MLNSLIITIENMKESLPEDDEYASVEVAVEIIVVADSLLFRFKVTGWGDGMSICEEIGLSIGRAKLSS